MQGLRGSGRELSTRLKALGGCLQELDARGHVVRTVGQTIRTSGQRTGGRVPGWGMRLPYWSPPGGTVSRTVGAGETNRERRDRRKKREAAFLYHGISVRRSEGTGPSVLPRGQRRAGCRWGSGTGMLKAYGLGLKARTRPLPPAPLGAGSRGRVRASPPSPLQPSWRGGGRPSRPGPAAATEQADGLRLMAYGSPPPTTAGSCPFRSRFQCCAPSAPPIDQCQRARVPP